MKQLLEKILSDCSRYTSEGVVASYIPELAKADPSDLGICIISDGGKTDCAGDYEKRFTMQSVVKPLVLLLALEDRGEDVVERICGVEATGKPFDAFNYSDLALKNEHINPMINAGAIALCTLIKGDSYDERFSRLIELAKRLSGDPSLSVDEAVYLSEKATGNKNRALAYMLKAYGMIDCDIEEVLDMYFKACSISVNCKNLAAIAYVLANHGIAPGSGEQLISAEHAKYVNAIMTICGMYNGSGEFALRVGIPAKSGVGGGIMAAVPSRMGIGIYSPALDKKGNSVAGVKALERLSEEIKLSIF
ncbi:MAG: glutaminase A [Clostridia bacterium]|nr:glutaminase A [Clostridia bacterium]